MGTTDRRRVVVTPAGRRRYLDLLYRHLKAQRGSFDTWLLLVNTGDPADIGFCERLAARNEDWIETRYATGSEPSRGNLNIHKFLNEFCADVDVTYLRLDDDVVYLAPGFVDRMFAFRESNPSYFLTYGNVINNAVVAWIHQKLGTFGAPGRHSRYDCMCDVGLKDPAFAESLHRAFLARPEPSAWSFGRWVLTEHERCSVNAVCWFGADLAAAPVGEDEEQWLAVVRPRETSRVNAVCGDAVCVHYAFAPQRAHLDALVEVMDGYRALAPVDAPAAEVPRSSARTIIGGTSKASETL